MSELERFNRRVKRHGWLLWWLRLFGVARGGDPCWICRMWHSAEIPCRLPLWGERSGEG